MALTIGFGCIFTIGFCVVDLLSPRLSLGERLSLAYGMGIGCISLLMCLLWYGKLLHSPAQLISIMVVLSIALFMCRLFIKKGGNPNLDTFYTSVFRGDRHYWVYAVLAPLFIFSVLFSYYYPVIMTDGNDYEITGKLIALNGSLAPENFFRPYPPLIPLAYSFIFFLGGTHPKIIFSFFYLSLVFSFYYRLSALGTNKRTSLVFTLILATTPYVWWHSILGILNLTAAYYFSIATLFWFSHLYTIPQPERRAAFQYSHPLLSGVFYSLSIFARFEMLAYFLIPLVLTVLYSLKYRHFKNILCLSLPPLCVSLGWCFYAGSMGASLRGFGRVTIALVVLIVIIVVAYYFSIKRGGDKFVEIIDRCEAHFSSLPKVLGVIFIVLLAVCFFIPHPGQSNVPLVTPLVFFMKTVVAKAVTCIVGNGFFLFTSALMVLLFSRTCINCGQGERERGYLFIFILFFIVANIAIFSSLFFSSYPESYAVVGWNYDLGELLRTMVNHPGQIVNNTQIRGLLPLYPVIIFFFAISKKVQDAFEV